MTIDTLDYAVKPLRDWRRNPNLADCFEDCVAMFRAAANRATDGVPITQAPPPNTESSPRNQTQ